MAINVEEHGGDCAVPEGAKAVLPLAVMSGIVAVIIASTIWRRRQRCGSSNRTDCLLRPLLSQPYRIRECFIQRRWDKISAWLGTLPPVASSRNLRPLGQSDPTGPTALHFAILHRAPIDLVQRLAKTPGLAGMRDDARGETALCWAVRLGAGWGRIAALLEAAPATLNYRNVADDSPLDILWKSHEKKRTSPTVSCPERILKLLDCYAQHAWNGPEPAHKRAENYSFAPLHAAAQCPACPDAVFATLLREHSMALMKHDSWGRTPLHWAALQFSSSKVQQILAADPSVIRVGDTSTGRLPLHAAVLATVSGDENMVWEQHQLPLLRKTPTHQHRDPLTGLPLFAIAPTVDLTFRLLRYDPTVLQH